MNWGGTSGRLKLNRAVTRLRIHRLKWLPATTLAAATKSCRNRLAQNPSPASSGEASRCAVGGLGGLIQPRILCLDTSARGAARPPALTLLSSSTSQGGSKGLRAPGGSPSMRHCPSPAPISQELTPKGRGLHAQVPLRPSQSEPDAVPARHRLSHPTLTISRCQRLLVPLAQSLPFQPPSTIPAADLSKFSKQLGNYR